MSEKVLVEKYKLVTLLEDYTEGNCGCLWHCPYRGEEKNCPHAVSGKNCINVVIDDYLAKE